MEEQNTKSEYSERAVHIQQMCYTMMKDIPEDTPLEDIAFAAEILLGWTIKQRVKDENDIDLEVAEAAANIETIVKNIQI